MARRKPQPYITTTIYRSYPGDGSSLPFGTIKKRITWNGDRMVFISGDFVAYRKTDRTITKQDQAWVVYERVEDSVHSQIAVLPADIERLAKKAATKGEDTA